MTGQPDRIPLSSGARVKFRYRNWRGVEAERHVTICEVYFGSNTYHPEPQFILSAIDRAKGERRFFALRDISDFEIDYEAPLEIVPKSDG